MHDIPPTTPSAPRADPLCDSSANQDSERERLIDDLAFLVVRQHCQQRVEADNDPITDYAQSSPCGRATS